MTYEEMVEFVEDAIDTIKCEMQDEINTVQQELDNTKADIQDLREAIEQ